MNRIKIIVTALLVLFAFSCRKEVNIGGNEESFNRPEGWTTATHSNNIEPNYDVVFNQAKVNKIHIVFTNQEWAAMQSNLLTVKNGGYRDEPAYADVDFILIT